MSDRAGRDAAEAHFASLRRAVSCITRTVLLRIPLPAQAGWLLTLATSPTTLRGQTMGALTFNHEYTVRDQAQTGAPLIATLAYQYVLLTAEGIEVLAYHWHPAGESHIVAPHLHITARAAFDLSKVHLPTGIVTPQAVLRCLITECGVEPLRPDWDAVLSDA